VWARDTIRLFHSSLLETSVRNDYLSVGGTDSISTGPARQDDLYRDAADKYGSSLERLASAYEADPDKRRDLSQDIHFQLWRSFQRYDARCSLRTWVYRVAHHVAASHVLRERRVFSNLVSLEELEMIPDKEQGQFAADQRRNLERLSMLIRQLKPLDRQVIISYLEDMDAVSIGEITGLSPGNVAMRIHRIKNILAQRFHQGSDHAE
jgi:RNA polymerase sigma-70 factor, ECF subfamily